MGTRDSGLFWFFDPDNWEILIKVLDGCAVNGHHWVYGASTTDLGYEIRVRDTTTDKSRVYRNEPGQPAPAIVDGKAFSGTCEASLAGAFASPNGEFRAVPGVELVPVSVGGESGSGCESNGTSLCLAGGRFEVTVAWSTTGRGAGPANVVPGGTNNSGLFYFFEPNNWEMLIKVLDGCAINGHYWVYSAAATDLGLDIAVTDTETGSTWEYTKTPGPPAPAVTESEAFPDSCGPLRPTLVSPGTIGIEWSVWEERISNVSISYSFVADFDSDGDEDVLLAAEAATEGSDPSLTRSGVILFNNGDLEFEVAAGDRPQGVHQARTVMADFDGDGSNDFFNANHGYDFPPYPGEENQLLLWTPEGYVDASDRLPGDQTGYSHSAAAGDIDRDGDVDILVLNNGGEWIDGPYFLMNDGRANFVADRSRVPDQMNADWRRYPWAAQMEDFDGDGHLDLLAAASGRLPGNESFVYWGSAAGEYRDEDVTVLPTPAFFAAYGGGHLVRTAVHDFNGDGRPDVLLNGYDLSAFSSRGVQLLVNAGDRAFADETRTRLGASAWSAAETSHDRHRFFDFNGDGTVDIVPQLYWAPDESPNVMAWLNDGTGRYVALKTSEFEDAYALGAFRTGMTIQAGGELKRVQFWFDGTTLEANAAFVVEGAVIRRRD